MATKNKGLRESARAKGQLRVDQQKALREQMAKPKAKAKAVVPKAKAKAKAKAKRKAPSSSPVGLARNLRGRFPK